MAEFTATLHSTLQAYKLPSASTAYFTKVFKGEPSALMPAGGQALCRWRVARSQNPPEGARVLTGARMATAVFAVDCYWPLTASEGAQWSQEDDIAVVLMNLPNSFIALTATDYTLGGKPLAGITVEDPSPVERSFPFPNSEVEMRVLSFEVHARILEG